MKFIIILIGVILLSTSCSTPKSESDFSRDPASTEIPKGIKGKFLNTTDPFGLLAEHEFKVLIIDSVPIKADKNSKIAWLGDQKSLNRINEMLKNKVTLVFGKIPDGTTADAFVLPASYKMTTEVLAFKKDVTHKNILFLQEHASYDVISHELQHWMDYEDGTFNKFLNKLIIFSKKAKLTDGEFTKVQDAVVEIRGHARQEITLMEDPQTNNQASLGYVASIYQHYVEDLIPILERLKKKNPIAYKDLLSLLSEYELPTKGNVRFTYFLSDRYPKAKK
jgi:hypothetical protein